MLLFKLKKRFLLWLFKKTYFMPKGWEVDLQTLLALIQIIDARSMSLYTVSAGTTKSLKCSTRNIIELLNLLDGCLDTVRNQNYSLQMKSIDTVQTTTLDDYLCDDGNYPIDPRGFVDEFRERVVELINTIEGSKESALKSYYKRKLQILFIDVFNLTEALLEAAFEDAGEGKR